MDNIIIEGGKIYMRELDVGDASQGYCNWLNDPIVNRFLETKKSTIEGIKQYIKEKKESPNCLFLGIFLKDANKHIGNIKLEPIDFENKEASLGILIGDKDYWGQNICTKAVRSVTEYAFKNLNLEKINLGVISKNKAAIKCYLNAGFNIDKIEPVATEKGKPYDRIIMSTEKASYENKKRY